MTLLRFSIAVWTVADLVVLLTPSATDLKPLVTGPKLAVCVLISTESKLRADESQSILFNYLIITDLRCRRRSFFDVCSQI